MDIKADHWNKSARQQSQFGPIFGDNDIVIHSQPTVSMNSSTDLPNAYTFPSHISPTSDEQDNLLAGRNKFVVDDLETFYYESKSGLVKYSVIKFGGFKVFRGRVEERQFLICFCCCCCCCLFVCLLYCLFVICLLGFW